jgi:hypothetical protein
MWYINSLEVNMGFAKFMSSTLGRVVRIVAGIALIALGLVVVGGAGGILLALIGAIPFIAGLLDICIIGAIFMGTPLRGAEVRSRIEE